MVININAELAATFNLKIPHPTAAVRQRDLDIVMTGFQFDHAHIGRSVALGLPVNAQRKTARIGRDLNLSVLDLALLFSVGGRRRAGQAE